MKQTIETFLDKDASLDEKIHTLFRVQSIATISILTPYFMTI